ncbi:NADPH oxidase regulator NoxR [Mycena leptocephala]|nr:NADPH oxidase regulator NoxR [Mycena leptocephala]
MSLKAELNTWASALEAYDAEDFEKALELFSDIEDSAKILTNIGLIYAALGDHETAVERFTEAISLDSYLAVAHFQSGVSNFLLDRYELAYENFKEALLYLRGNQFIDYEQLGLSFKLFSAEVLFNQGLSLICMGRINAGLADMEEAKRASANDEHKVINEAIADRGDGYTVFSVPIGVLYRPSEKKVSNAKPKDYLGTAVLVATSDSTDTTVGFSGLARLPQSVIPAPLVMDGETASGLVRRTTRTPTRAEPWMNSDPVSRPKITFDLSSIARKPISRSAAGGLGRSASTGSQARSNISPDKFKTSSNIGIGGSVLSPGLKRGGSLSAGNKVAGPVPSASLKRGESVSAGNKIGGPIFSPGLKRGASLSAGNKPLLATVRPPAPNDGNPSPLLEIYSDYFDSRTESRPPMPNARLGRLAPVPAARSNIGRALPTSPASGIPQGGFVARSGIQGVPIGGYAPRRRLTRRNTSRKVPRAYQEEEGYASGEENDAPFELINLKIRVKLHYADDIRGMAVTPRTTTFNVFMDQVRTKFGKDIDALTLRFIDEDGSKVSLLDESDYELAIETARNISKAGHRASSRFGAPTASSVTPVSLQFINLYLHRWT